MKLRITGGELRGRFITAPATIKTRPTTEKNRSVIFNILANRIDFEGCTVLDLYAGSGALGFEAISRGAVHCDFVEKSPSVVQVLAANIAALALKENSEIYTASCLSFVKQNSKFTYTLILADPPFFEDDIHEVVAQVFESGILDTEGVMVVERSIQTAEKDSAAFGCAAYRRAGDSLLYFLTQSGEK